MNERGSVSRRAALRAAAWTAPAVTVAVAAPAYAATSDVSSCQPSAECKLPGDGSNTKDYAIRPNCSPGTTVLAVRVRDDKEKAWIVATPGDGTGETWIARGFNDSRKTRLVEITTKAEVKVYTVAFPPC